VSNKPKKWIAMVLSIFTLPLGMLYVAQPGWAVFYFLIYFGSIVFYFACSPDFLNVAVLPAAISVVCALHAYRIAGRYPDAWPRPWYSRWYGLFLMYISVPVLVVLGIRSFFFEPWVAPSRSMVPNIRQGDYLLVQKWGYGNYGTLGVRLLRRPISWPLVRGDVLVFEYPLERSILYVKRLIGLPGDQVSYRGNKLLINGAEVPVRRIGDYSANGTFESQYMEYISGREYSVLYGSTESLVPPLLDGFVLRESCTPYQDGIACIVPPGHYFVLGDNRDNSSDSRSWGFLPADHVVGRVVDNFGGSIF